MNAMKQTTKVPSITEAEYRLAREERRLAMLRKIAGQTPERPAVCLGLELAEVERRYNLARKVRDAITAA